MFSQMTTLTYVTAYLYDFANRPLEHPEFAMEHLRTLSRHLSMSHLLIFVLDTGESAIRELLAPYAHVTIVPLNLDELWTYVTLYKDKTYELPRYRNLQKDTREHLWRTHACVELAHRATEMFPDSTHICWLNFTVPYLFRKPDETFDYLRTLTKWKLSPTMLAMPGCTNGPLTPPDQQICWRFCGAVFWGDAQSIKEFYNTYCRELPPFLEAHQVLPWEVNFWAYLETTTTTLAGAWYPGNHDDSIVLGLPPKYYTQCLADTQSFCKTTYEYPAIADMRPTSAAFLQLRDGRRILNTRYVNYWMCPDGGYLYPRSANRDSKNKFVIENANMLCHIDDTWMPSDFRQMKENNGLPENVGAYSRGLEDIRLYEYDGKIKCIATNVNYVNSGRNRMVLGNYCLVTGEITDGRVLQPPQETWCEKNWIPVNYRGQEAFIYQWWPMHIGVLDENDRLTIVREHKLTNPLFKRVRGSTLFLSQTSGSQIGVVHFSEEGSPRKYFHMLVELESESLMPIRFSQPFCFESLGVEFCMGFAHTQNEYLFWISRMDRDPCMIRVSKDELILSN